MASIFRTLRFRIAMACFAWIALFQVGLTVLLPIARDAFVISVVDRRLDQVGENLVRQAQAGASVAELVNTSASHDEDPSSVRIRVMSQDGPSLGTCPPTSPGAWEGARSRSPAGRARGHNDSALRVSWPIPMAGRTRISRPRFRSGQLMGSRTNCGKCS
jgi:hypothetical protein